MGQQIAASFSTSLSGAYTEVGQISLKNLKTKDLPVIREVSVSLKTTGADLTGFRLSVRPHANADWQPLFKETADFTPTPPANSLILGATGTTGDDPTSLADGESIVIFIDKLGSTEGLRFEAQTDGAATIVDVEVGSDV